MKFGLVTRGKWTSEHDISQDMYFFIYTHICKSEVSKYYIIFNALYIIEFYYFLYIILKFYMLRMTQNYIFEKVFIIWYMIGIENTIIK